MINLLKFGLILFGLIILLHGDEKIDEKDLQLTEVKILQETSLEPLNKKSVKIEDVKSNVKAVSYIFDIDETKGLKRKVKVFIKYIFNADGTYDAIINLFSDDLNLMTIETLKELIKEIKKDKNVEKVYLDIGIIK
ncbi:hypothetical protein [Aliarcobacter butzleri]|uniref:hypothetical protein n=1 Tax=Aliarcobacter butzleri TaxID=28197 RepID=UPI00126A1ED8|nr:hypothetical protein [Aliarcobacter butzleri]